VQYPVHHNDPVAIACRFIHAEAGEPIGIAQIAAAAHLSERGLQHAFRATLGTTPLTYLRRVRLARAHDDLVTEATRRQTGRTTTTVNEIARLWHFTHPSRFAALYLARYGAYPAQTMRDPGPDQAGPTPTPTMRGRGSDDQRMA
jgi:AraC-like DNA-binding protein